MTGKKDARRGAKERIRAFFLKNVGRVVEGEEIRAVSGNISEWARRVRELRDEEGYQILSHRDRADLKPGQYFVETAVRKPAFARGVSKETRAFVLERNGYTCYICGFGAGDPDPLKPGRTVRLTMGHILDKSKGGADTPENLRAVCTNCNEGLQNIAPIKPDLKHLLAQVRRAPVDVQMAVYEWLGKKYAGLKKGSPPARR